IQFDLDQGLKCKFKYADDQKSLSGFIQSGILMYHMTLQKSGNKFTGIWKPFMVESLEPSSIYLSVEKSEDSRLVLYPFFGDQRFTGTWCMDFQREGDIIRFRDFKTGLNFKAQLLDTSIQLDALLGDVLINRSSLSRSEKDWEFGSLGLVQQSASVKDGWKISNAQEAGLDQNILSQMEKSIRDGTFTNTHSVLIAKEGKIAYETYFDGYQADIPHDQRSASKSFASAMIGIGLEDGLIESVEQKLYDFIPQEYQSSKDAQKSKIRIQDLLTMSSGFEVSRNSGASEGNYQNTDNWLKSVLEASMKDAPGTHANYSSASPFLLGICLDERLDQPMELYMDEKLLAPLGIHNYIIQSDETRSRPYFGGGMYLTSRDMLKFGQLYLNKGQWQGKQILSEDWVQASHKKHFALENVIDKNDYGYQWWHHSYQVGDKTYASIEARGNGGQYIFVLPELASVVVITSGNYNNGKLIQQPEQILEEYILPAIVN
ncbi:MAG: serine hydrolase, partial [Bacteroidota bacterium]